MSSSRAESWSEGADGRYVLRCQNGKGYVVSSIGGEWRVDDPYGGSDGPFPTIGRAKDAAELRAADRGDAYR